MGRPPGLFAAGEAKLLAALTGEACRATNNELGEKLGKSPTHIGNYLRSLRKKGKVTIQVWRARSAGGAWYNNRKITVVEECVP